MSEFASWIGSHVSLLALGMFAVLPLVVVINMFRTRARQSAIATYVTNKGYVLLNPPATTAVLKPSMPRAMAGLDDIDGLAGAAERGDVAFVCRLQGHEVTIFNATVATGRPDATSSYDVHYRVAKIKQDGLPRFSIGRHGAVELVQKLYDRLSEARDSSLDRADAPAFSKKYWMKGPDSAAVSAFFTSNKLEFLAAKNLTGTLASNSEYLVYFESQTRDMRRVEQYERFVTEVDDIICHLLVQDTAARFG